MSKLSARKLLSDAWTYIMGFSLLYIVLLAPGLRLWESGFNRVELTAIVAAYSTLGAAYFISLIKHRAFQIVAGALAVAAALVLVTYVYASSETFYKAIQLNFSFLSINWKVGIVCTLLTIFAGNLIDSGNGLARAFGESTASLLVLFLVVYYIRFWNGFDANALPANFGNWIIGGTLFYFCSFFNWLSNQMTGAIEKLGVIGRSVSTVILFIFLAYLLGRDAAISKIASFVEFQQSSWGRSYSSVLIVAAIGSTAYFLRRTLRSTYGLSEIIVGFIAVSSKAKETPDIVLSPIGWLTLLTVGAYLIVRGLDNFETGLTKDPRDPVAIFIFGQTLDPIFKWLDDTEKFTNMKDALARLLRP